MSWFAHAVAGSLYALGFGAYFGLVLEEFGVTIFGMTGGALEKPLDVGVALLFIGINFRGVSETGLAGNVVTMAKVLVILIFIGSGLAAMVGEPASWDKFTPFTPQAWAACSRPWGSPTLLSRATRSSSRPARR